MKNHLQKIYVCWNDQVEEPQLSAWFNSKKRSDVKTTTDWNAPIIWEGTYNRKVLEEYYKRLNITIGLVVFAHGKLANWQLKQFLQSADKHFMVGYNVIFYILIDHEITKTPILELGPLRTFKIFYTYKEDTWNDPDFIYMMNLRTYIIDYIQFEVNFLFSMTANQIFKNDFGVETLGRTVAQLHSWWYFQNVNDFPYERRHRSSAFIPYGQGDFYYHGATFGGKPHELLRFFNEYQTRINFDATNKVNSTYEKHLNKYLFVNKPTKLLSPEYNWDPIFKAPPQIKQVKIAWQREMS
nr:N-acetyllactosaminide alpha-1,3-galactosyltransferase-like 1 isoform X2 [Oryctolagus cuniculus]